MIRASGRKECGEGEDLEFDRSCVLSGCGLKEQDIIVNTKCLIYAGYGSRCMTYFNSFTPTMTLEVLQLRKATHREAKYLAQGHCHGQEETN